MLRFFNYDMQSFVQRKLYRYRLLFSYVIVGFTSIALELILRKLLLHVMNPSLALALAVCGGILFAFVVNVRFNFKVPRARRNQAVVYFIGISLCSFTLSALGYRHLQRLGLSYESSRLLCSGGLFFIAYALHRRFSFQAYKQVGVAVYANRNEDIRSIWKKIMFVEDFIHVDIVDSSFNTDAPDPATYRVESVRAYWPNKEIHCHIMSKAPSKWIDNILDFVDTIVIHHEIDEELAPLLKKIKANGKGVGICLLLETPVSVILPYVTLLDEVMLLAIRQPGESGQKLSLETLERIKELDSMPHRNKFVVCVDGGVDGGTIQLLQAEKVISGSFVLNGENPMERIMRLQTSSQYEAI